MKTILKVPHLGQKLYSRKLGIHGTVIRIMDYHECFPKLTVEQRTELNHRLVLVLGNPNLYYEVVVQVTKANKKADYLVDEEAILTWEECQTATFK